MRNIAIQSLLRSDKCLDPCCHKVEVAGKAALLVRLVVLVVASMGVAELSWRFIESPFLRRKSARYGDRHQDPAAPATPSATTD